MLIVVAYDVPDDRRRARLADALEDFGVRVQYSVFECLLEQEQVAALRKRVGAEINAQEDAVRIYRLCAECAGRVELLGLGEKTEDPEVYVV